MDNPVVDAPIVIASLLILAVLLTSAVLWIRHVQRPRDLILPDIGVAPWSIGWVNFGIFISAIIIGVFVAQQIGLSFVVEPDSTGSIELTPWLAVFSIFLLQGPMIAVFYLARRFYPGHYAGKLSQADQSFGHSLKQAIPLFIMFLPVIWIATLIWSKILSTLQRAGFVHEVAPQELITLFQGGGDIIAIVILVFLAIIVAPLIEEIIFRGCIYRFLKSQTTMLSAQVVSSLLFAAMHANMLSFFPLVVVGILLARIYEKSGSLTVAICFHAFFNAFSLSMLFITSMSEILPTNL